MRKGPMPEHFLTTPIKWGPIGETVYKRSYSQHKEDGTKEIWPETVVRTIDGNLSLVPEKFIEPLEREKLLDLLYPMGILPAGRHLSSSGRTGRQFVFNCHASGWDGDAPQDHFTFLFDQLMQGGGVGANYSDRYIDLLPPLRHGIDLHIICDQSHPDHHEFAHLLSVPDGLREGWLEVDDSREGWVESVNFLMQLAFDSKREYDRLKEPISVTLDVSKIRRRGSLLKTSGGIACGPGPLVSMLSDLVKVLNSCVGRKLDWEDSMVLDHTEAACVIAGGKRRSSRMSVKYWKDPGIFRFINIKREDGAHWTTNISVEIDDEFLAAYAAGDAHACKVMKAVVLGKRLNGEPGFWNRSLAAKGERNPELMYCPNPCGEIGLQMWENCFSGDEKLITKEYGSVRFIDVVGQTVTVQTPHGWKEATISCFGQQAVQRVTFAPVRKSTGAGYQKTRSNYRVDVVVTPNHRWEKIDGNVTSSLGVGDVVPMNAAPFEKNDAYKKGVQHGIIFGDGSADRQYDDGEWRHRARLFGAKADKMAKYFDHLTYPESCNGVPEAWLKSEKNLKEFPAGTEGSDYLSGFIEGWGMADANDKSNGSIHLGSSHPQAENWLKENAAVAGWVLRASKDSGTSETNLGVRKSPLMFFTLCRPGNIDLAWQVVSIEVLPEPTPVYCATVPGVERFTLSSGISTCNCNLGHINLEYFAQKPKAQAMEAFRLMTRFLIRATFADIPQARQRAVVDLNRRIGVGFTGFHGFIALRWGLKYSECHLNHEVRQFLIHARSTVETEAQFYAPQLGIAIPVKNTALAPVGSTTCLPGATSSGQAMEFSWFKRLIRYSNNDPELAVKRSEGYDIINDEDAVDTSIVINWCEHPLVGRVKAVGYDPTILETQQRVPFLDSLKVQAMFQELYADNAVSFTINLPPDLQNLSEEEMERQLVEVLPKLKGTTVYVDKSRKNAPFQAVTKEEFDAYPGPKQVTMVEEVCKGAACPT